ncbi:MAG: ankyrin repeat domain-containing protein, partial [Planctomycetes bacterium]|nr:ankyrin repeat domain-containing protein [Planctomycetota bacterium]
MMHWIAIAIFQVLPAGALAASGAPTKSPLHEAAASGDTDRLKELLTAGAEVDSLDDAGQTPLHKAAAQGRPEAVKLLLDKGADANAQDANGKTPLQLVREAMRQYWDSGKSIPHRYRNLGELLASGGADVGGKKSAHALRLEEVKRLVGTPTPLYRAARQGSKESVESLLDDGADISARGSRGMTALHAAAEGFMRDRGWSHAMEQEMGKNDYLGTVTVLLENGAAPSAPDNRGNTPLHWAASGGYRDVAETLLAFGAQMDAANSDGRTPLGSAVRAVGYLERDVTRSGGRGK